MSRDPRRAVILEIMRMSTEDGPGIRTTVFFKGCTLKCAWCHNPESISPRPQIHWIGSRCLGCKLCLAQCPRGALSFGEGGLQIDRAQCEGCGRCAAECPSTALEPLGRAWELDALVREVVKDRAYFEQSDGGITISGGEPTMQPEFAAAFLAALREAGIHTALDTCGQTSPEALATVAAHADLVLYDLKEIDPERHREFTGVANDRILDNLKRLAADLRRRAGRTRLWIRTPIIPGATDRDENLTGIGRFIAANLKGLVDRWDLCAFNNLCRDKYTRLGLEWPYRQAGLLGRGQMERLAEVARQSGVDARLVHWSGSTRMEADDEPGGERSHLRVVKGCATC